MIDTRIRPAAATQDGGDVTFRGFKDGVVYLEFHLGVRVGPHGNGIENMLRHYDAPEGRGGQGSPRRALPKPGLETPEGKAIQDLLEEQVNPAVAAHGGHISLVDVQDDTVYIRLEGGCQGCGMADVTLRTRGGQPGNPAGGPRSITKVLDVTDHAGGTNPYYQPGKGGISPV